MADIEVGGNTKKEVSREKWRMILWVALIGTISIISAAAGIVVSALGTYAGIGIILITSIILSIICVFKYTKVKKKYKGLGIQKLYSKRLWKWAYLRAPVIVIVLFALIGIIASFMIVKNSNSAVTAFILNNITKKIEEVLNPDDPWGDPPGEDPEDPYKPYDPTVPIYEDVYEGDILVKMAQKELEDFTNSTGDEHTAVRERYWKLCAELTGGVGGEPYSGVTYKGYTWHWCSTFVGYCFFKAGEYVENNPEYSEFIRDNGKSLFTNFMYSDSSNKSGIFHYMSVEGFVYGPCRKFGYTGYRSINDYTPQPGDLVMFKNRNDSGWGHIGIIEKAEDNGTYTTIEGNVSPGAAPSYSSVGRIIGRVAVDSNGNFYSPSDTRIIYIYHPDYKTIKVEDPDGPTDPLKPTDGFKKFNMEYYKKGADGYYDGDTVILMCYDYLVVELGYSPEAAWGVIGNIYTETAGIYDQAEVGEGGVAWITYNGEYIQIQIPGSYGNGNYRNCANFEEYARSGAYGKYIRGGQEKTYGFGYGICGWSDGFRPDLIACMDRFGIGFGPDSIKPMLAFLGETLENGWSTQIGYCHSQLLDIQSGSDILGVRKAALLFENNYEKGVNDEDWLGSGMTRREYYAVMLYNKYGNRTPLQYTIKPKPTKPTSPGSTIFLSDTIPESYEYYYGLFKADGNSIKRIDENSDIFTGTYKYTTNVDFPYSIYVPKISGYNGNLALIIYLAGGNGTTGSYESIKTSMYKINNKDYGYGNLISRDLAHPNAIVVCPTSSGWWPSNGNGSHSKAEQEGCAAFMKYIEYLIDEYPIDANRIYVTGVSRGGCGTFSLLASYPDFFAAVLPVAGAVNRSVQDWTFSQFDNIETPVRIVQGSSDGGMGTSVYDLWQYLNNIGKYCDAVILDGGGHEGFQVYRDDQDYGNGRKIFMPIPEDYKGNYSWKTKRYTDENSIDWLLSQVRGYSGYTEPKDFGTFAEATFIGDSNTVAMYWYKTAIQNAKHVLAVVGASTSNWNTEINYPLEISFTPEVYQNNKNIKDAIQSLDKSELKYVGIMLGTNDLGLADKPNNFKSNYTKILDTIYSKNSNAKVTLFTILPINESTLDNPGTVNNANVAKINQYIKELSKEYTKLDIRVFDLNSQMSISDMDTQQNNGYHLSGTGATKCANIIDNNWS